MTIQVIEWNGKPISQPGFYANVPLSLYHSGALCVGPSLSSSGLRRIFMQSEAHFYDRWPRNPLYDAEANGEEESEALILGRAVHHLLMGQPHFDREFIQRPKEIVEWVKGKAESFPWNGNRNSCKAWLADAKAKGLTVLPPDMITRIEGMRDRLAREHLVTQGALNGLVEITMARRDPEIPEIWLLQRPDVVPTDGGDFVDLKTIGRDIVSHQSIVRAIGDHGYNMQAAMVRDAWQALTGQPMGLFSLYFVESRRPYCAKMVTLSDADLDLGWRQCRNAVHRFVAALNTGRWPGPGGDQTTLEYVNIADARRAAIEAELRRQGEVKQEKAA